MKRALAVGAALGAVLAPSPALAAPDHGMVLECDSGLVVTRTNGSSWWGGDGGVYRTRHLRITDLTTGELQYEKHYGPGRPEETTTCVAQHGPFPGYTGSVWTVTLDRAG